MASIQKRGPAKYRVRYRGPDKAQRSKTFARKSDAERFRSSVETDINRGAWIDPDRGRKSFASYSEIWLTTLDSKPSTRASYESILSKWLLPEFGNLPVERIDWSRIEAFKSKLLGMGKSARTIKNILNALKPILSTAVRDGALFANPAREVKIPDADQMPRSQYIPAGEIVSLTASMEKKDGLLVIFAAFTGLRAGECGGLRVGDIDFLGRKILVQRSVCEAHGRIQFTTPKSNKARSVPVPQFLIDLLAEHLAKRGVAADPTAQVFTSRNGEIYRHSNFYKRIFKPAVEAHGLEGFRFHDLRHSYAALLIQQGAHPRAIMERLGHSSIQVTINTYGHLFPSLDEALTDGLEAQFQEAKLKAVWPECGLSTVSRSA